MNCVVRRRVFQALLIGLILSPALILFPNAVHSQAPEPSKRKLLLHADPLYPESARNLALSGVVKLDVLVAPDGSVKDIKIVGGHPVLAEAAVKAVRQWKWEPSPRESHELVRMPFSSPLAVGK
jgi:TonB family protein